MKQPRIFQAFGRPAARRLLLTSAAVAVVLLVGGIALLVSGRVEKLSGACVGLARPDGGNALVVWPAGTTFAEDSSGPRVPGYGAVTYGSQLTTAGGFVTIDEWVFRAELPQDCDAKDVAYIAAEQY